MIKHDIIDGSSLKFVHFGRKTKNRSNNGIIQWKLFQFGLTEPSECHNSVNFHPTELNLQFSTTFEKKHFSKFSIVWVVRVKKWHYRFFLEKGFSSTNTEKTITQAILTVLENEKLSWNPYLKIQLRWHQCRYSKTPTSPQKKPLKFLRKKNSVFYS